MEIPSGRTLAAVLDERTAQRPHHPALIHLGRVQSYAELQEASVAVARALLAQGLRQGDRVGVLLANQPEWVVMALAASRIGAIFVPLNTWYKESEIAWTLEHCGLGFLVAATDFLKTSYAGILERLVPELRGAGRLRSARFPDLRRIVLVGAAPAEPWSWDAFLRAGEAVPQAAVAAASAQPFTDQPAFILYTSGSTAAPKGVLLNHASVIENGWHLGARRGIGAEDRVWIGTPLFYGLGATNALPATLTHGATLVLQGHFEPGLTMETIERDQATVYYATGNMTRAILDHPDYARRRMGSLTKGNAGLGIEYKRLTLIELGIKGAVPAYGLTETYGNAAVGEVDDPLELKLRTEGRPVPGMEFRIVDPDTGAPVAPGEKGLVLIRGHTTPGYFRAPPDAMAALRPDGFFDTGDIGHIEADGSFVFSTRLKDVIKSGGINVSPLEVEALLTGHPDVRSAHVVGLRSTTRGELIIAFVDRSGPVTEAGLRSWVKDRAASFKTPHHVFFRREEQFPRLSTGKIAKNQLIEEARRELGPDA